MQNIIKTAKEIQTEAKFGQGQTWAKINQTEYTKALWATYDSDGLKGVAEYLQRLSAAAGWIADEMGDPQMAMIKKMIGDIADSIHDAY